MRTPALAIASVAVIASLMLTACGGSDSSAPPPATPEAAKSSTPPLGAGAKDPAAPPMPTKPDSAKVTWKKEPKLANCHNEVKTGKDLVMGVTAMATACAGASKLHQVGKTVEGSRTNLDPAQVIPLHVEANHCYRVYGLSEDALQDLDIAVKDSGDKWCGEDGSDSPDAVVLEDGLLCFNADDDVKINVVAGSGAGKFAVQIWGD
jgi:hypothetical protein